MFVSDIRHVSDTPSIRSVGATNIYSNNALTQDSNKQIKIHQLNFLTNHEIGKIKSNIHT